MSNPFSPPVRLSVLTRIVGFAASSLGIALLAFLLVAAQVDVGDDHPLLPDGPGLTLDEGFNIEVGVYLVQSFETYGLSLLHPASLSEIFGSPLYFSDHPPLGRLWLGLCERLGRMLLGEGNHSAPYVLTYARLGSAVLFAVNIWLVGWFTSRWHGPRAGLMAAVALLLMPRAYGHAHLASLETAMGLAYSAVLLVLAERWSDQTELTWRDGILPGVLLGLAFLTKIQAIFLPPMILVWGLWNWRQKAIVPGLVVAGVAFAVFFVGWPWLWLDPVEHLREYFARTTERQTLYCHYFGEHYADKEVPCHYSPVMFVLTMPLAAFLLGGFGHAVAKPGVSAPWRDPRWQLLCMGWLGPILFFTLPGIAVYDGIRLFLVSVPIFAVFVGVGANQYLRWLSPRCGTTRSGGIVWLCLLSPLAQMFPLSPCWLSYYSEGAGTLPGAKALGCELNYWGDAVTPELLRTAVRELPQGATLDVAPVLHPATLDYFLKYQTQLRERPDLRLRGYDPSLHKDIRYVLVFRRLADPWESLSPPPTGAKVLGATIREGVVLAELLELPPTVGRD